MALGLTLLAMGLAQESVSAEGKSQPLAYGENCDTGDCFPENIRLKDRVLPLRGESIFRYFGFRMYTAALYFPEEVSKSKVLENTPKYLALRYHRSFSAQDIKDNTVTILKKNPQFNAERFAGELKNLFDSYKSVSEGDIYSVSYDPADGMRLFLNGTEQIHFESPEFAKLYLGIWLSDWSVGEDFRHRLLWS